VTVEIDERSRRQSTNKSTENAEKIQELIHEDRRRIIHELVDTVETLERNYGRRKGPETLRNHNWFLLHDNAPNHTSLKTTEFVTNNNMVIVPNPPYSPGLAPCDFASFPKLKMQLKGRRFETVSNIQKESQAALDSIKGNDFHGASEEWGKRKKTKEK
jgi:hypothetical protein